MDLNKEIQIVTDKVISEKLPQLVEEKVTKMINDILEDVFRSYGDTAKAIKNKIEEKLDVNLQNFDLIDYNHLVSKTINDNLLEMVNIKPIMDLCQDAIGFVNQKTIRLSSIIEMFKDAAMEDDSDNEGEISIHIEQREGKDWTEVWLDAEADQNKENCGINFLISNSRKKIFCMRSGSHWSKQGEITPFKMYQLSKMEHKIFRIYSAQVEVEVDETDFDNSWSRNEY